MARKIAPFGSAVLIPAMGFSAYTNFTRAEWARLRASTPLTLSETDLAELQGLNEQLSMDEVVEVYLPLSRLLNLHVAASRELSRVTDRFLDKAVGPSPYLLGVAGSVAVGKSTIARVLRALLARWPDHPRVDLVTAPVYSHLAYDILLGEAQLIRQPDILILEGLNVLQGGDGRPDDSPLFVSDYFDFSIYVDAEEAFVKEWFLQRFRRLRETAFRDPQSYFRKYAELSEPEASAFAARVWDEINGANLRENILPTRERAHLVLEKGPAHRVERIRLRRI
jgi:type I pantothenate kinase